MFKQKNSLKLGFTLVETMVSVLIFSIIIVGGFKAYNSVLVGKIKLIESTDIQKEAFYFSEKFFEEIKRGGTIDYEEYFNRTVRNGDATGNALYSSGHYTKGTGFGNYSDKADDGVCLGSAEFGCWRMIYCRSNDGVSMGSNGCISNFNSQGTSRTAGGTNITNATLWYGQYALQFIDYNSNFDGDNGDEDNVGGITGDDDDEYLGLGPAAFSGSKVDEIYLISADTTERTLFRWNVKQDPDQPGVQNCLPDYSDNTFSGGCLGTIEFLKLKGLDIGKDHNNNNIGTGHDGIIDTWVLHPDFDSTYPNGSTATLQHTIPELDTTPYWQPLFSDDINVSDVKFHLYPNKDLDLAWRDASPEVNIAPYIRIQMVLSPSFKAQRGIKGDIPEIKINTTISLTDIYSR